MQPTLTLKSLLEEVRAALSTDEAAAHLGLKPQTLRGWASAGAGPIRPFKVGGRLRWRTDDIRKLLGEP